MLTTGPPGKSQITLLILLKLQHDLNMIYTFISWNKYDSNKDLQSTEIGFVSLISAFNQFLVLFLFEAFYSNGNNFAISSVQSLSHV